MASLPLGDVYAERLRELLGWLSSHSELVDFRRDANSASENESQIPVHVMHYFDETGYNALYAVPLNDDQGRVGLLL